MRSPEATQIIGLISGYGWTEGRLKHIGMLQAMVDESGQPGVFLLAGLVATAEAWIKFSDQWKAVLRAEKPLSHFKMKDFLAGNGVFANFSESEKISKFNQLRDVLLQSGARSYTVIIHEDEYREVMEKRVSKTLDSPRFFAAEHLVKMVLQDMWKRRIKGTVDFVYDSGSQGYFREIEEQWREMKRSNGINLVHKTRMGNVPIERDDETFMPLQAADMLAGQIRKYHVRRILEIEPGLIIPPNPLNLTFKARAFRRVHIEIALNKFLRQQTTEHIYEDGKARSTRLSMKS